MLQARGTQEETFLKEAMEMAEEEELPTMAEAEAELTEEREEKEIIMVLEVE
jgi:hypothetical protein